MTEVVKNPRPHAELRKLWADDDKLEIEYYCESVSRWIAVSDPYWHAYTQYRVKPKPLVAKYRIVYETASGYADVTCIYYLGVDDFKSQHEHLRFNWVEIVETTKRLVEAQ